MSNDKNKSSGDLSKFGLDPIPPLTGKLISVEMVEPRPQTRAPQRESV